MDGSELTLLDAIDDVDAKAAIVVGIAFGLKQAKQRLGDVLIASRIVPYEKAKLRPDRVDERGNVEEAIDERGQSMDASLVLRDRFVRRSRRWRLERTDGTNVQVHQGDILSGEKLINNKDYRDSLSRRFPDAIGGEMEGAGEYAAAKRRRIEVLLVKAICDWADGHKNDRAQRFAAASAAMLVEHVLSKPDVLRELQIAEQRGL